MTFFYALLAFIAGLLLGWFLWGRSRDEDTDISKAIETARGENNKLRTEVTRVTDQLHACTTARADLERDLQEAKKARSPAAALTPTNLASFPARSAKPGKKPSSAGVRKVAEARNRATTKDNLRRLIGVGPVNERKLNEHGIITFAEIAGWSASDIKRVEEYLEFDGRIKRERWVEQARLLAAGKEAEFARRFPTAGGSGNT